MQNLINLLLVAMEGEEKVGHEDNVEVNLDEIWSITFLDNRKGTNFVHFVTML